MQSEFKKGKITKFEELQIYEASIQMTKPRLLIFAGAGASVDSGLSTFRSVEGGTPDGNITMWGGEDVNTVCSYGKWRLANYQKRRGTFDTLRRIHNFYKIIQDQIKTAQPNTFHHYVANLIKDNRYDVTVLTTNIDDLFERAGVPSSRILHLHGSIFKRRCVVCDYVFHDTTSIWKVPEDVQRCPRPKCQSRLVKTDVTFYGEKCSNYLIGAQVFSRLKAGDSMIMVGASGETFSHAQRLWAKCRRRHVHSIHINPSQGPHEKYPSDYSMVDTVKTSIDALDFHLRLRSTVSEVLYE